MAYITETVGVYSELIAEAALMAAGYVGVARPTTREYYDLIATDRISGKDVKFQVKTLKRREDRGDNLVLFAKKGDGTCYTSDEAIDYYVGVLVDDGITPRVFLIENRGISEYWMKEERAQERWIELPLALDRGTLTDEIVQSTALEIDKEFRKVGV
ncbi:hypothetical protein [Virgibacillus proomii]|uniref:hypothetical protein n=1 Tax=Virgibacillus proomii TaxID=84407 RepID=UPI001C0FF69E|nr:hypothetical protein [Virgibacillus proomii]MBU5266247.1 hypothetical protein [Virgibacillus proomii]